MDLTRKETAGGDFVRRKFISDIISNWIAKNPAFFENWKKIKDAKIKVQKDAYGTIREAGQRGFDTVGMIERLIWTIPEPIYNQLEVALENPRFCEMPDEEQWFIKNFPVFRATEKY